MGRVIPGIDSCTQHRSNHEMDMASMNLVG